MTKISVSVLTIASICASVGNFAYAAQADDVAARIDALEKENAAIRKENAALREKQKLHQQQNTGLKSQLTFRARTIGPSPSTMPSDPFGAYAADLPVAYKAAVHAEPGQLRLWGEGGAIWSGGDPIYSFFSRTGFNPLTIPVFQEIPGFFALTPKPGWEAATGFDHRFAASPWHVSGQFRYGEATRSASATFSDSAVLPGGGPPVIAVSSDAPRAGLKETHWLGDMALGRDILGNTTDGMQFKFGVRVAELSATVNASNVRSIGELGAPVPLFSSVTNVFQESKFLGAGPRIGIEGSAPLGRGWTIDYLGDLAALFGTQRFQRITSGEAAILGTPIAVPPGVDADQRYGTVFNADVQVGISYWMAQNLKINASYRWDAYLNVLSTLDAKNDPTRLQRIDRYTHGPRLGVTAQF